ncbi:transglutaminase domain-containing protein [Paenibacillus sp. KS-LC4]|uniref:DUF4129 domain-containing transglutaminase family protein n=1 Tax=Paenibacillus sp. KS-LC4 TaxID=2979727 RepID=UPI0030D567E0
MRSRIDRWKDYAAFEWYGRISRIIIIFSLINSIAVFENYWWKSTFICIYMTLLLAGAVDVLLPAMKRRLRMSLQLLLVFVSTWVVAGASPSYSGSEEGVRKIAAIIWSILLQFHPYIWFSLAMLVLYGLFSVWTTSRIRIFGFIGANLLVLTVADSFTPIWLWGNVAWVVLLGLIWLAAGHLHLFQRNHPGSWTELLHYPLQLFMPIAAVLALLMAAGLFMPSISPVLRDPYTIWKESKGEKVNVFLGEKGSDSGGATLDTSSGYGRDDDQLGGGFNFDYSPVMTVASSHRSYWRGETKSFYTGSGWLELDEGSEPNNVNQLKKEQELSLPYDRKLADTIEVEQTVTMIRKDQYPVLFAAAPIHRIHWINDPEANLSYRLTWAPDDQELRFPLQGRGRQPYPESYSVVSTVPVLDEAKLRSTNARLDSSSEQEHYTQLPDNLPVELMELAKDLTKNATNDYDRAKMLESYLRLNFAYTNEPDLGKLTGASDDFVAQFLFEIQEGYCDYFSTAMAVLARSVDLPTRWVKGFAPGSLPAIGADAAERFDIDTFIQGEGTYTVRNSDAHSWVEIYFAGYGWVSFEPTAGFAFPYTIAGDDAAAPTPEVEEDTDEADKAAAAEKTDVSYKGFYIAGISLLVLLLAVSLIVRRQALMAAWLRFRFRSYTANDRIVWETERLLRVCRRKGLKRSEHETLREAVQRFAQHRTDIRSELTQLLNDFERAKYGGTAATPEEAEQFVNKVKHVISLL